MVQTKLLASLEKVSLCVSGKGSTSVDVAIPFPRCGAGGVSQPTFYVAYIVTSSLAVDTNVLGARDGTHLAHTVGQVLWSS